MDTEGLSAENKVYLEVIVHVYNINYGHNQDILQKCETLNSYSILINKIREYIKSGLALVKSIEAGVKYCMEKNILTDFLKEYGGEVINMLYYEYNLDDHLASIRREYFAEGEKSADMKWQGALADKDAALADLSAEIARLREQLANQSA